MKKLFQIELLLFFCQELFICALSLFATWRASVIVSVRPITAYPHLVQIVFFHHKWFFLFLIIGLALVYLVIYWCVDARNAGRYYIAVSLALLLLLVSLLLLAFMMTETVILPITG